MIYYFWLTDAQQGPVSLVVLLETITNGIIDGNNKKIND